MKTNPAARAMVFLLMVLAAASPLPAAVETPTAEQIKFFESKVRPVLAEHCYGCHSEKAEKIKGGLVLDTRDGIRKGGENGPAVVPGDLNKSLLIQAIRYDDEHLAMPPKRGGKGGKLSDAVIADFEQWVRMGAPDPREGKAPVIAKKYDTDSARKWWAFQPARKPAVPQPGAAAAWAWTDIDRFVLAGYEQKKLKPVADADRHALLRRASIDLTGLPPSPELIERFTNDKDPRAFERIVDELLQSPRYGERWGRHWLDVARFAETSGRDLNLVYPEAWRYRDYVVESFDADKPFDQFIREQIAGDLLPDKSDEERARNLIATGFLAIGPKPMNESIARQFAVDQADEQIDAVSQAFLGITIACARCHDHKFDPVTQRDYTALAGIFLSTDTRFGTPGGNQARNASSLIALPASLKVPMPGRRIDPADWRRKSNALQSYIAQRNEELRTRGLAGANLQLTSSGQVRSDGNGPLKGNLTDFDLVRISTIAAQLEAEVSTYYPDGSPRPMIMAVLDKPGPGEPPRRSRGGGGPKKRSGFENVADAPFLIRGDIRKEGERIPRGLPEFLSGGAKPRIAANASGRLELANWIASPRNVLTSRVFVNRVWHWLFGRGLVASVDNFGTTGSPPTNPELLDHLALRFIDQGWSVKKLLREIMLSHVYQLSCDMDETNFAADPDNTLCWRMNQRRMDAESLRDSMLFASGALDLKRRPGSILADVGEGPVGGPRNKVIVEDQIVKANGTYRSLYLPIARNVTAETLAVFDFSDPSTVQGARQITTVPPQSLYLMNSQFVSQQSEILARRVIKGAAGFDERFRLGCLLVWSRPPNAEEAAAARAFLSRQPEPDSEMAWIGVCRALFGAAEFRYLN